MRAYDSTVKLARAIRVDDVLVAIDRDGERLCPVLDVTHENGQVVVIHALGSVRFESLDAVRLAHPDVVADEPRVSSATSSIWTEEH